jgi:uncharacterized damage-inducible protein DinB
MRHYFLKLFEYHNWATQKLIEVIEKEKITDEYILKLYSHLLNAQWIWLSRIRQKEVGFTTFYMHPIHELPSLFAQNQQDWLDYLQTLDETELNRIVSYINMEGKHFQDIVSDIITQVLNHGTHHRAQINSKLRELDFTPPGIDYIFYTRQPSTI